MMMMSITTITAIIAVIMIITVIIIRMRTELMVVMIIILPFQIRVSGVCGAPGQPAQSRAAVESGSGTDDPWLLLQGPAVRANRHRARAATQDFAQVQRFLCFQLTRYLHTVTNIREENFKNVVSSDPLMRRPFQSLSNNGKKKVIFCSTNSELCLSLYIGRVGKIDFSCFPGERCEDRGRTYQENCANQCPRSCTDLWEHVQCLQGACHPGNL